MPATMLADS